MKKKYLEYFEKGTRNVPEEEIEDEMRFYFTKQNSWKKRDLVYSGLNVDFVCAYLAATKY